jgi:mRNA degradation ribonuclease J1/J2
MAAEGRDAHKVAGQSGGVPEAATNLALPRARFHENVAAAYSAVEAAHLVEDSPGHLRNLMCPTSTHASIGVALEPALRKVEQELESLAAERVTDPVRIAQAVRRAVGKWVGETYRRQPMIVPTVLEV